MSGLWRSAMLVKWFFTKDFMSAPCTCACKKFSNGRRKKMEPREEEELDSKNLLRKPLKDCLDVLHICLKIRLAIKLSIGAYPFWIYSLGQLVSNLHRFLGVDHKSQGTSEYFQLIIFSLQALETFASDEHHACAPLQDYKFIRRHTAQSVYRLSI